jgi:hypothetical protein
MYVHPYQFFYNNLLFPAPPIYVLNRKYGNGSEEAKQLQYNEQKRYAALTQQNMQARPIPLIVDAVFRQGLFSSVHMALRAGNGLVARVSVRGTLFPMIENKVSNLVLAIQNCPQEKNLLNMLVIRAKRKDINYACETNALVEAAKLLDKDLVESLLKKNAMPDLRTPFDQTPLSCAIRLSREQATEPEELESTKTQIKKRAAKMFSVAQTLLLHGASVDAVDAFGKTPLHYLCNQFFDEEINLQLVSFLIEHGADPEQVSWEVPRSLNFMAAIHDAICEGMVLHASRLKEQAELYEKATSTLT